MKKRNQKDKSRSLLGKARDKQIIVGMSGGVDSSLALVLLQEQGWQPIGVSLKYAAWKNRKNLLRENICCRSESFKIAKDICKKLNVPYYIFDVSKEFKKEVIEYFISELKNNKTPNPCIICNRYLKFKKLFAWAKKHHIKYVATGHYARVRKNPATEKYELLRAKDKEKDQTYSLCFLPQKWLKYIVFPLGDYTKSEIYKMAEQKGFDFFLKQKQSQDFCFVAGKSMPNFITKEIGIRPGLIKDKRGSILGQHPGLHFYTLGQRKGINLAGGPYFVVDRDSQNNVLIVTKNKNKLLAQKVILLPYHFISGDYLKDKIQIQAKIRYRQPLAKATLFPISKSKSRAFGPSIRSRRKVRNKVKLIFNEPQKAITPGQFAVFYQKDVCLGGGKISLVPISLGNRHSRFDSPASPNRG